MKIFGGGDADKPLVAAVKPSPSTPTDDPSELDPDPDADAPVAVDYASGPIRQWSVSATDSGLSGDNLRIARAIEPMEAASVPADVVVVTASNNEADSDAVHMGIDTASGDILWRKSVQNFRYRDFCQVLGDGSKVACTSSLATTGTESHRTPTLVEILDSATGEVTDSFNLDVAVVGINAGRDGWEIVGESAGQEECQLQALKVDAASKTTVWLQKATARDCPGMDYWTNTDVNDKYIAVEVSSMRAIFDRSTGAIVADVVTDDDQPWIVGTDAYFTYSTNGGTGTISLADGSTRPFSGPPWGATFCPDYGDRTVAGFGDEVVDLGSNAVINEMPDAASDGLRNSRCGDKYVFVNDDSWATMRAYEIDSGNSLWEVEYSSFNISAVLGDTVIAAPWEIGSVTRGYDVATGQEKWAAPGVAIEDPDVYPGTNFDGSWWPFHHSLVRAQSTAIEGLTFATADGESSPTETAGSEGTDIRYATPCGTPPTFEVTALDSSDTGITATLRVTANCPAGDTLQGEATEIRLFDTTATGSVSSVGALAAVGVFDFSRQPLAIPPSAGASGAATGPGGDGSAIVSLAFPVGTFWRLPDEVDVTTIVVECERDATESAVAPSGTPTYDADNLYETNAALDDEEGVDEGAAEDALRWQADHDAPAVINLQAEWVAQLSSKRPGLEADGKTWDNRATYDEFIALKLRHPDALLMYTGDWDMFSNSNGDFWVTVNGEGFPSADSALGWCVDENYDAEHCYAKYIDTASEGAQRQYKLQDS